MGLVAGPGVRFLWTHPAKPPATPLIESHTHIMTGRILAFVRCNKISIASARHHLVRKRSDDKKAGWRGLQHIHRPQLTKRV